MHNFSSKHANSDWLSYHQPHSPAALSEANLSAKGDYSDACPTKTSPTRKFTDHGEWCAGGRISARLWCPPDRHRGRIQPTPAQDLWLLQFGSGWHQPCRDAPLAQAGERYNESSIPSLNIISSKVLQPHQQQSICLLGLLGSSTIILSLNHSTTLHNGSWSQRLPGAYSRAGPRATGSPSLHCRGHQRGCSPQEC